MSLPATKERVRRKEERPSEIIAAALELFVERGFAATRLDDVARRAGVSKGTPYLYFKNKEDLFRAVVTETIVARLELGEQTLDQFTGSSEELLRLVLAGWWEFETSKACGIRKLMIAESGNFPSLAEFYVAEVVERGKRFVGRVLERGIAAGEFRPFDVPAMVRIIAAPLTGYSVWETSLGRFEREPIDRDRYFATYLEMILRGLRADPADRATP